METVKRLINEENNRRAIVQKIDKYVYKATCFVNLDQIAPATPPKIYKTLWGAERYARKFLSA